ncbi:MAG: acyl-CoA dehydrogenase family protein [Planctomycetota bacterium]
MNLRAARVTHDVQNQPPLFEDVDLFAGDAALREAVERWDAGWALDELGEVGRRSGSRELFELGRLANIYTPKLRTHSDQGHRLDEVEFHPAYHQLMEAQMRHGAHCLGWTAGRPGAHVARAAIFYLLTQPEAAVSCPISMTHAVVPSLRNAPELAAEWEPRIASRVYDPSFRPASEKRGVTLGMAMTEKQGGSDVRANTTEAAPLSGDEYLLRGHKWFCSAPMCDAFLTLAQAPGGLTCFFVPRWLPDGTKNNFFVQRLKEKLGNRANASSEIEYDQTWARRVGEEGRGVSTIIEMVHSTRIDVSLGCAGIARQAVARAIHHCRHRAAFGKRLVEQPLMLNVLADLALETEAATTLALRVTHAMDRAQAGDAAEGAFGRIATAVAKYWIAKRCPAVIVEALECHGGNGYVEEGMLARLYREAPLGSIWEGSGNVQCLDVLRALRRTPEALPALLGELESARGGDARLDAALDGLRAELSDPADVEPRARRLVERLALTLQASLLVRHAPQPVADAFCGSRLVEGWRELGTLAPGGDHAAIVARALPG